ncbi:hypothetical protein CLAFUW4_13571 [Fulvia fulva]|uniref:Pyridoxamine 5'-phosphate oxidase Alr4036 family FMN-binding domain-containing protein n=1 Tax=Passalora fulva TaxID=5499 RepID=A0A9Q8PKU2_PASFU|nr:uncharacterized protein CLAFUR5_13422 [Fulvia fulva]KAK4610751.1 hypothetical protein CLAFUR4_13573 [Fulvia fulva]KAK4610804.1 hypothetical protein CLAFUR0_13582 [Fulvia fulva]UJO24275.1 hypothetical protein CLAFUR5_13422 [Fulvia fulva]WPV21914.1 hypothetical protein CLAFUW4_13571 [Fulvia fulva]WPV37276.1 hypothetical protein CLAFUW7_13578 [Fulvia fulva]
MVKVWNTTPHNAAPWKEAFLCDMDTMEGQEFAFSTLHNTTFNMDSMHSGSEYSSGFEPRNRFCAFRCFWAELPDNASNPAPRNEGAFVSDMPTFTTDVRTEKIPDLFAGCNEGLDGSGGGAPCEAVWWIRSTLRQWRVRGRAYVVGPDIEGDGKGALAVRQALRRRMRVVRKDGQRSWSWSKELTAQFGNLSPSKRGRFVAPPPGRPVDEPYDDEILGVGRQIHDLEHPIARKHFRVVVIVPEVVERLDMQDPRTARKHVYTFNSEHDSWTYQECWP